ncbi:hypothetical protein [Hymenobacter persicinus]|uniref:STAS/SEC14 domain-containing protein n=1 Tax=Hymenobacter persicinus TaxID=2025506 RepID=A0A4Q5LBW5_9BACT|nr:hypothetical protein [Hymenobacter persicinus]RYU80101.1 hypothetical protein EWM57_09160 [Hymenobacter persicinus]
MPLISTLDFLQVTYRPELRVLVLRWMRQTTLAELQQGYQALLAEAATHQCWCWLVDARRRDSANQDGTQWMMDVFFPQLAGQIHHKVYLAYLFAPTHLRELEADNSVPALTYFDGRPYQVERFTEELAAMQWLQQCQRGGQ